MENKDGNLLKSFGNRVIIFSTDSYSGVVYRKSDISSETVREKLVHESSYGFMAPTWFLWIIQIITFLICFGISELIEMLKKDSLEKSNIQLREIYTILHLYDDGLTRNQIKTAFEFILNEKKGKFSNITNYIHIDILNNLDKLLNQGVELGIISKIYSN